MSDVNKECEDHSDHSDHVEMKSMNPINQTKEKDLKLCQELLDFYNNFTYEDRKNYVVKLIKNAMLVGETYVKLYSHLSEKIFMDRNSITDKWSDVLENNKMYVCDRKSSYVIGRVISDPCCRQMIRIINELGLNWYVVQIGSKCYNFYISYANYMCDKKLK